MEFEIRSSPHREELGGLEKQWRELVQAASPGLPLVGQTGRIAKDGVLNSRGLERAVQVTGSLVNASVHPSCAGVEIEQRRFLVEGGGIGEDAVETGLEIDIPYATE